MSPRSIVLNACRHQRSVHGDHVRLAEPARTCSTPVGIKDRFTFDGPGDRQVAVVLNACRHQRSVHSEQMTSLHRLEVCSTPVGIKDRFTRGTRKGWLAQYVLNACRHQRSVHIHSDRRGGACCASAQRLSASKIGSHHIAIGVKRAQRCSTPVGIKDRFTPRPGRPFTGAIVLNACRHQRSVHGLLTQGAVKLGKCSTPVGIKDRFTDRQLWEVRVLLGAQRLSASKIGSPTDVRKVASAALCSTPVGIKDRFTRRSRRSTRPQRSAQRLSASKIGSPSKAARARQKSHVCSTPVGIKDRFTRRQVRPVARWVVLNACRHQRSVHWTGPAGRKMHVLCSTPVGIKDRFTKLARVAPAAGVRAQRLSASKIGSPG